jgi:folate-dependent tRNA-U54 methylase TrmFO/GidA
LGGYEKMKKDYISISISKLDFDSFYNSLCRTLTEWETAEISDFELYDFLVDLEKEMVNMFYNENNELMLFKELKN